MEKIIKQVEWDWIEKNLEQYDEYHKKYFLEDDFKFILIQGPNSEGYVRFGIRCQEHYDIAYGFLVDLSKDYKACGGGFVQIEDFCNTEEQKKHRASIVLDPRLNSEKYKDFVNRKRGKKIRN